MDKIKAFFQNKIVKIFAWVILALDVVALIVGGATKDEITNGIALTIGIIGAVTALIAFIGSVIVKESTKSTKKME